MHGFRRGVLRNLLLTTKAIADDDGFLVAANGGKEHALAERLGDFVLVGLEAEGTGHAAAAGVQKLNIGSGSTQELHLVLHALSSMMMAVTMNNNLLVDLRRAIVGSMLYEELAEEKSLVAELGGTRIVGKKVGQFIAEDRSTTWLEDDDGGSSGQLRSQSIEDFEEIFFGRIQHAEVVERAAAAEMLRGQVYAEACVG